MAGVVVLVVATAYPASGGPLMYAANRGWVSKGAFNALYRPIILAGGDGYGRWYRAYCDYVNWWAELGYRHRLEGQRTP